MLVLHKNICCNHSSEPSRQDNSDEGSKHMILGKNKKNYLSLIIKYSLLSRTLYSFILILFIRGEWSGGAMVLGKLPVPGRPTILITVGQGPIALAVGAGGGGLDIFTLIYPFCSFSLSLGDGQI